MCKRITANPCSFAVCHLLQLFFESGLTVLWSVKWVIFVLKLNVQRLRLLYMYMHALLVIYRYKTAYFNSNSVWTWC